MKIIFCDTDKLVIDALQAVYADKGTNQYEYEFVHGDILDQYDSVDAFVSPANSFGFMDGGIDLAYLKKWPTIEDVVMKRIQEVKPLGELLIGDALTVEIPKTNKYLIVAPTMRMPRRIFNFDDVLISARAAAYEARICEFDSIAMSGFGTLTGLVPPKVAANMMYIGITHAFNAKL